MKALVVNGRSRFEAAFYRVRVEVCAVVVEREVDGEE